MCLSPRLDFFLPKCLLLFHPVRFCAFISVSFLFCPFMSAYVRFCPILFVSVNLEIFLVLVLPTAHIERFNFSYMGFFQGNLGVICHPDLKHLVARNEGPFWEEGRGRSPFRHSLCIEILSNLITSWT